MVGVGALYRVAVLVLGLRLGLGLGLAAASPPHPSRGWGRSPALDDRPCSENSCPRPLTRAHMTYDQVEWYLQDLAKSSVKVELVRSQRTGQNRSLFMVIVRPYKLLHPVNPHARYDRPAYYVEAGFEGSAPITTSTVLHIIDKLAYATQDQNIDSDYYIVPLVNPDGYEFARTIDASWKKTRSIEGNGCFGVNVDRNFPSGHGASSQFSEDPCSEDYRGRRPSSSEEVASLLGLKYSIPNLRLSLTLAAEGNRILYPGGIKTEDPSLTRHVDVGTAYTNTLQKLGNANIQLGTSGESTPRSSGTSMDFIFHGKFSPLAFTIALRPTKSHVNVADHIKASFSETFHGFMSMVTRISEKGK